MPSIDDPPLLADGRVAVELTCTVLKRLAFDLANDGNNGRLEELRMVFSEMTRLGCDAHDPDLSSFISEEIKLCEADCLWRAARSGNLEVLRYLLGQRGVHPEARRAMQYAERYARRTERSDVVDLLVSHGAADPRPRPRP